MSKKTFSKKIRFVFNENTDKFFRVKKKIKFEKFKFVLCVSKKSLIANFEIQKQNHNNKSTRTY